MKKIKIIKIIIFSRLKKKILNFNINYIKCKINSKTKINKIFHEKSQKFFENFYKNLVENLFLNLFFLVFVYVFKS